jgi:hypothetical protein
VRAMRASDARCRTLSGVISDMHDSSRWRSIEGMPASGGPTPPSY